MYRLSLGALARVRWLYPAYFGAYLAYASSGQLVPGYLKLLIEALKARLGYPPSNPLPFQFGALTALPFVLAGLVLVSRLMARAERGGGSARVRHRRGAAALHGGGQRRSSSSWRTWGRTHRPALWSALALSSVCVFSGLWFERVYLSFAGALRDAGAALRRSGPLRPGGGVRGVRPAGAGVRGARQPAVLRSTRRDLQLARWACSRWRASSSASSRATSVTAAVGIGLSGAAALLVDLDPGGSAPHRPGGGRARRRGCPSWRPCLRATGPRLAGGCVSRPGRRGASSSRLLGERGGQAAAARRARHRLCLPGGARGHRGWRRPRWASFSWPPLRRWPSPRARFPGSGRSRCSSAGLALLPPGRAPSSRGPG